MATEGTNSHEDSRVASVIDAEDSSSPNHHQQAEPSSPRTIQFFPPHAEIERDYVTSPEQRQRPSLFQPSQNAHHNQQLDQFQNGEMGRNHGPVDPFAHGGLGVSIGYNMPYSSNVPFHMGYSSTLQMPPIQQPIPHNPLGVAVAVGLPSIITPNWQPQIFQQPNGLPLLPGNYIIETTYEIEFEVVDPNANIPQRAGVTRRTPPNIYAILRGLLPANIHPNPPHGMGELSRNVRMRTTLPSGTLPLGNSFNQGSRNLPTRPTNSVSNARRTLPPRRTDNNRGNSNGPTNI